MPTIELIDPGKVESNSNLSQDTTLRHVPASKYHLFWRTMKRNGVKLVPFTTAVMDGELVTVKTKSFTDDAASRNKHRFR